MNYLTLAFQHSILAFAFIWIIYGFLTKNKKSFIEPFTTWLSKKLGFSSNTWIFLLKFFLLIAGLILSFKHNL